MLPKEAILIALILAAAPDLFENLKVRISSSFSEQEKEGNENQDDEKSKESDSKAIPRRDA